jgi:hypothetical protein
LPVFPYQNSMSAACAAHVDKKAAAAAITSVFKITSPNGAELSALHYYTLCVTF